jgi:hypothetical protein
LSEDVAADVVDRLGALTKLITQLGELLGEAVGTARGSSRYRSASSSAARRGSVEPAGGCH